MKLRLFATVFAAALGTAACGSDSGDSKSGGGDGGNAGTNVGTPGCTTNVDCTACADACSACLCSFGDAQACAVSCDGAGGSGGVGGTGPGGSGPGGTGPGGSGGIAGGAGFYPMPDWPTGTPEEVGLSTQQLDAARQYSESIGGNCLTVIRDGKLVYERYYNGGGPTVKQKSWSIAKTFTGALIGIAITRGEIQSVDEPAANYVPAWQGKAEFEKITLRHVLDMVSGLTFDLISDNTWTVFTNDMTAEAVNNTITHAPDTVYEYSNHGVQVLEEVLSNATGEDPEDYARQHLWTPLGFAPDTSWERDGAGNVAMFMNVNATCKDFARLGYLYLHNGVWEGKQIIRADYIQQSLTPSSTVNHGHSHYVWLNGNMPYINSTQEPQTTIMFPMAPFDLFSYQGIGQNFVDTVPSTQTIYQHARPAPHDPFTNFIIDLPGTMDKLFRDGSNIEHKELLKLLIPAG